MAIIMFDPKRIRCATLLMASIVQFFHTIIVMRTIYFILVALNAVKTIVHFWRRYILSRHTTSRPRLESNWVWVVKSQLGFDVSPNSVCRKSVRFDSSSVKEIWHFVLATVALTGIVLLEGFNYLRVTYWLGRVYRKWKYGPITSNVFF